MGCNVSSFSVGVPRLAETRTLSTNIAETNTLYDVFVADDRCIINIAGSGVNGVYYVINDQGVGNSFATESSNSAITDANIVKSQGRFIATTVKSLLLLLEKGDRIRIYTASRANIGTHTATVYIYR